MNNESNTLVKDVGLKAELQVREIGEKPMESWRFLLDSFFISSSSSLRFSFFLHLFLFPFSLVSQTSSQRFSLVDTVEKLKPELVHGEVVDHVIDHEIKELGV